MFRKGPTEAEAAQYGLTLEEASGPAIEIWPDNLLSVNTFIAMLTQWRTGVGGATGLDYGVMPDVMRMTMVPRREWPQVFEDIRIMEDAGLEAMRAARKES